MSIEYHNRDMKHIKRWLDIFGMSNGWKKVRNRNDIEIWQKENKMGMLYQISVTLNTDYLDYMSLIPIAVRTIGESLNMSEEEAFRSIILEGLILDDIIPFKNKKKGYEGFILQWASRIGFGEYTIYRKISKNKILPFEADSESMDNKDKRFLKELMRQFVEKVEIIY